MMQVVHGYLLANPETVMPEILFNNPYLSLAKSPPDAATKI